MVIESEIPYEQNNNFDIEDEINNLLLPSIRTTPDSQLFLNYFQISKFFIKATMDSILANQSTIREKELLEEQILQNSRNSFE